MEKEKDLHINYQLSIYLLARYYGCGMVLFGSWVLLLDLGVMQA